MYVDEFNSLVADDIVAQFEYRLRSAKEIQCICMDRVASHCSEIVFGEGR